LAGGRWRVLGTPPSPRSVVFSIWRIEEPSVASPLVSASRAADTSVLMNSFSDSPYPLVTGPPSGGRQNPYN
jgi:hypothetical protein